MYSTLFCCFFQLHHSPPSPSALKANHRSSNIVQKCYPQYFLRLTNEILLVFVCENHFVDHPTVPFHPPRASSYLKHSQYTHRLSSASNNTTRFSVFRFLYQNKFPCQTIFVQRKTPFAFVLAIHIHLFSRKIQKQRSEQPSLCLSHDGEHIDFCDIGLRELRYKAVGIFSRRPFGGKIYTVEIEGIAEWRDKEF
jgi:hypothetical protein